MQQKWNQSFDGEPMMDIPQKFLTLILFSRVEKTFMDTV